MSSRPAMPRTIDLNADVGEGAADDDALLSIVTSANVACGQHAGDPAAMRRTCRLAVERGVRVGAHPGYADREAFGRRELGLTPAEIEDLVAYQLGALVAVARLEDCRVTYVKVHGALYHRAATDAATAGAVAGAAATVDPTLAILGPPRSELLAAAVHAGLGSIAEGFADRAYAPDGGLLDRSMPGSMLSPQAAAEQAVALARAGAVESICIHGDGPAAAATARAVAAALQQASAELSPFS